MSKTTELLNKETLQEVLNEPFNNKTLKVELHNGKNSYYIRRGDTVKYFFQAIL